MKCSKALLVFAANKTSFYEGRNEALLDSHNKTNTLDCFCYLQSFLLIQTYYLASISVFKLSLGASPHLSAPLSLPNPLLPPPTWSFA